MPIIDDDFSVNDSLLSRYKHMLWPAYAALVAALAAVFFADLRHLLLGVDDAGVFRDHVAISEDFFLLFSPDKERAGGRIIDEFAMWLGYLLWGNTPAFFHLLIAAVHALASFSLACAFYRLGADLKVSLLGGLLFLVNIAHVETVHWMSALEYPMAVLNASWTLYFYARICETPGRALLWAFYGGLVVCVLTHFVTVLLWPLCFFWSWQRGEALPSVARRLVPVLPLLALALFFVFRITSSDTTTQSAFDSYNESVMATSAPAALLALLSDNAHAFLWLLGRLVSMAHWLPLAPREQLEIEVWLGGALLVALLVLLWKGGRDVRLWCAWLLLFIVPFVPATLVHTGISRYLYLATAGSSFLLAWALVRSVVLLGRGGRYFVPAVLAILLISSYGAEERVASLTKYNSGRYYVTHGDPQIGVPLIEGALVAVPELLLLDEAYLYLIEGLLIAGEDYQGVLDRAIQEVPDGSNIHLIKDLADLFTAEEGRGIDQQLDHLSRRYAVGKGIFLHTVSILSQHFGSWFSVRDDDALAVRAYNLSLHADPQNLNTVRRLLKTLLTEGHYDEAVATVGRLGRFHQDNPRLLYLAGLSFMYANRLDEALESVRRAQLIEPSAELHILEGDILSKRGYAEEAVDAYRRAIASGAATPEPYLLLSYQYRKRGDWVEAIKVLESALGQHSGYALVHYNLGNAYHADGRSEEAVVAYGRAIDLDPGYVQAHSNLGTVLRALGRLSAAESAYRRAMEAQPENPLFHYNFGALVLQRGDQRAAIDAFRRAIDLGSEDPKVHANLGRLLVASGNFDEAIRHCLVAIAAGHNAAQFDLGLAYLARGDVKTARRTYAQGVERFGAAEAKGMGAADGLRRLVERGVQVASAQDLLRTFWP